MAETFKYSGYHMDEGNIGTSLNTHRYTRNDIRVAENELNPQDSFSNSKLQTSTNIFIYSNEHIVGMIQSFTINENRQITKLQAIGWEGVVQAVPTNYRGGSLQCTRVALYDSNLFSALGLNTHGIPMNALGKKVHDYNEPDSAENWDKSTLTTSMDGDRVSSRLVFKTLKDQRVPLEIQVKTRMKGDEEKYYTETYIDAWLASYSKTSNIGQATLTESATINYADVY